MSRVCRVGMSQHLVQYKNSSQFHIFTCINILDKTCSVFSHGIVCNIIDRLMTVEIPKVQHVHVRHYNKKCCTTIKRANLILDTLRHSRKPNFPHRKTRIIYHCNEQHFVRRLPNVFG